LSSIKHPKDSDKASSDGQLEITRPEHAVISTFDLFSIGGELHHHLHFLTSLEESDVVISGPKQLTYSWTHARRQDLHRGSARIGAFGEGSFIPAQSFFGPFVFVLITMFV
jgi:hypothetical protein